MVINKIYIQSKERINTIQGMWYERFELPCLPNSRDRIVVSTLRCGRSNPGSNPGHGSVIFTRCHGVVKNILDWTF